jgi:hypothetical protein
VVDRPPNEPAGPEVSSIFEPTSLRRLPGPGAEPGGDRRFDALERVTIGLDDEQAGREFVAVEGENEPACRRMSRELVERLAVSDDSVVAYKARIVAGLAPDSAQARAMRARISGSPMATALLGCLRLDERTLSHAYRKCQGPHWTLVGLAQIDYPPGDESLRPLLERVNRWLFSKRFLQPPSTAIYRSQEDRVRRCGSQDGNAIWYSVKLGLEDDRTPELVDRLIGWQWPDGGWNCDKRLDARSSSFQETVIPARGLWAYGTRHGHEPAIRAADRAAELLLSRRLLWRRHDGRLIDPDWGGRPDRIHYPIQFFDVLFCLQVMAEMGRLGDPRCADALAMLESKRLPDGGFPLELRTAATSDRVVARGTFADWGPGGRAHANPLVSLAALEVLRAAEKAKPA